MKCTRRWTLVGIVFTVVWPLSSWAELPAVPVPEENQNTEPKRLLGKILFWDEQLSSDNTVACGTCHRPSFGGADPRQGRHPGSDPGTIDDVWGSPGIVRMSVDGNSAKDPLFGFDRQVTHRIAPSNFGALWAAEIFGDGRAGSPRADRFPCRNASGFPVATWNSRSASSSDR